MRPITTPSTSRAAARFGVAVVAFLALATAARAASAGDPSGEGLAFSDGGVSLFAHRSTIGCTVVDPARVPGSQPSSSIDRPACSVAAATPAPRKLWGIQRANLAMSLRFAGGGQRGLGLLRGQMSYDHGIDLGPLKSWQFHAEAQLNAASFPDTGMPLEERARFALSPPPIDGWGMRFEAGGVARGVFDPATAPRQHLEFATQASRGFWLTPRGRAHWVSLRFAREDEQDLIAGTDVQTTRARLSYSHAVALGSINADLEVVRTAPGYAPPATATRLAVSFDARF